jgi:hypothetical protein
MYLFYWYSKQENNKYNLLIFFSFLPNTETNPRSWHLHKTHTGHSKNLKKHAQLANTWNWIADIFKHETAADNGVLCGSYINVMQWTLVSSMAGNMLIGRDEVSYPCKTIGKNLALHTSIFTSQNISRLKKSELNGSKHSQNLNCFRFPQECNFDLILSFPF